MNVPKGENEAAVMELLTRQPDGRYLSPTTIARTLHPGSGRHSAWASPICKRLVGKGLVVRRGDGWYASTITREALFNLALAAAKSDAP